MHGLLNRAIQCFVTDTYGFASWEDIVMQADLGFVSFEAMLAYDDDLTEAVLDAAVARVSKPRDALLEDLGIYLISNPRYEALRRLLRFAGETFEEFLMSVDELPDRARLVLPDLDVTPIRIHSASDGCFEICCGPGWDGFRYILSGAIRAMADDYGALVTLARSAEHPDGGACIHVTLHEPNHSVGRVFELAPSP
jgi:hypothetical protein